jgi:preprotein translocase subunit SecG
MSTFLYVAIIITAIGLIASVILQSKGAGLGGLTGVETGGVYTARRGIERTLFWVTLALSILFFALVLIALALP